ncbi:MAG: hypothetical protein ACRDGJ_03740, partial [Candidatus Limnocylindria bacterium]
ARTDADIAQAELVSLSQRLADPATYADAASVRQLVERHNALLDTTDALAAERLRLETELATAETAATEPLAGAR